MVVRTHCLGSGGIVGRVASGKCQVPSGEKYEDGTVWLKADWKDSERIRSHSI